MSYQTSFLGDECAKTSHETFHTWYDDVGCVQMFNASEILNKTVTVTDNIRYLEEHVEVVMKTQLAAGLFVFGMVIVAALTVTIFCVYVHVTDRKFSNSVKAAKMKTDSQKRRSAFAEPRPSTSASTV